MKPDARGVLCELILLYTFSIFLITTANPPLWINFMKQWGGVANFSIVANCLSHHATELVANKHCRAVQKGIFLAFLCWLMFNKNSKILERKGKAATNTTPNNTEYGIQLQQNRHKLDSEIGKTIKVIILALFFFFRLSHMKKATLKASIFYNKVTNKWPTNSVLTHIHQVFFHGTSAFSELVVHKFSLIFGEIGHKIKEALGYDSIKACCDSVLTLVLRAVSLPSADRGVSSLSFKKTQREKVNKVALEDLKTGLRGQRDSSVCVCGWVFEIHLPLTHPNQGYLISKHLELNQGSCVGLVKLLWLGFSGLIEPVDAEFRLLDCFFHTRLLSTFSFFSRLIVELEINKSDTQLHPEFNLTFNVLQTSIPEHATAKLPLKLHMFAYVEFLAQSLCSLNSDCASKLVEQVFFAVWETMFDCQGQNIMSIKISWSCQSTQVAMAKYYLHDKLIFKILACSQECCQWIWALVENQTWLTSSKFICKSYIQLIAWHYFIFLVHTGYKSAKPDQGLTQYSSKFCGTCLLLYTISKFKSSPCSGHLILAWMSSTLFGLLVVNIDKLGILEMQYYQGALGILHVNCPHLVGEKLMPTAIVKLGTFFPLLGLVQIQMFICTGRITGDAGGIWGNLIFWPVRQGCLKPRGVNKARISRGGSHYDSSWVDKSCRQSLNTAKGVLRRKLGWRNDTG
ncbi:hypothetical protein VP01_909g3 [Puccinia sorghi]|uniref:Uncharacterized protein n=1 Tax=Puccinia sorghi TaxID=27349 RepID=A0A0L6U7M6_9BASI|nr:hypothetical protein VP01_909g3 [Puccinia sorghi]